MARVLHKILAAADVDLGTSEKRSKSSGYLSHFSELLNTEDYHGCLRHVSSILNDIDGRASSPSMSATMVDLLLARAALNYKIGHADECFLDAQKALLQDRRCIVAYHMSYLALKELNELVKALAYLSKCFALSSGYGKVGSPDVKQRSETGTKVASAPLSAHGATLDALAETDLTDSRCISSDSLRQELFHFSLRTIQHVPGAIGTANSVVAPTDLPGVLTSIARNLYVKKQFELSGYCLEAVIVLCKNASGDVQNTLLCALESLANVYSALDMHERALAILARHQTLATEMESWFDVASASALQAQAHKAIGNLQQCEQCLQDRLDVLRTQVYATRDTRGDLIDTELDIAALCQSQRRMHLSVIHAESALSLARALSDRPALIRCHLCLGRLRQLLGLYAQSIFHFRTCLTVCRKAGDVSSQGWGHFGLAEVNFGLQQYAATIETCQTLLALPYACEIDDPSVDDERSPAGYVQQECRCRALLLLGRAHHRLGEFEKAAAFIDEARFEAKALGNSILQGYADCWAGCVATDQGTFMRAFQHLSSAMAVAKSQNEIVLRMHCHYRLGAAIFLGQIRSQVSATEHFYAAINTFTKLRAQYGSWSEDGKAIVDLPLECFEYLQECLVSRGDFKEAFRVAEFAHQRVYLDTVGVHQDLEDLQATRMLPLKMPVLNDLSNLIAQAGTGVLFYSLVRESLYMWLCLPPRGLAAGVFTFHQWSPAAVRYLLPFLRQNYFLLSRLPSPMRDVGRTCEGRSCALVGGEAVMYRSESAGQVSDNQGDPPPYCPYGSIAQRQRLSYPWVGDDNLIHPGRSSYLSAPAPTEDANVVGTESRASMRDLYDILTMPFERYLFGPGTPPVKDIVIVAQNSILLCPFSALVTSRRMVVCDFYSFRLQPCILRPVLHDPRMCDHCIAVNLSRPSGVYALVAGNPSIPPVMFYGQTWRVLPLPYAEREVRSVGLLLGPTVTPLVGTALQRHKLLALLPRATLIHLAMHISWELGALVVAPASGISSPTEKDVLITASDIARLHLQADLVILSGGSAYCHSSRPGAGLPQPGQHNLPSSSSLVTLARAFLIAGARSVLVPLWSIPDRATDEFMFMFYEQLKQGFSVGCALRETMGSVRAKRGFMEPVHWASYVHFGIDLGMDFGHVQSVHVPDPAPANPSTVPQATSSSEDAPAGTGGEPYASTSVASGGSLLLDVPGSPSASGSLRLQHDAVSSGQKKSVFDCMNNFVESVASAVDRSTADGDEDLCKVAVMSVLSPLYKVVSYSSELMASLPLSENSSLTGDIPLRTSSLADKGFADVEQLALAFTKVHGLLAGLGFIFNHNSEHDDYSLHFPDSRYFVPAHAAVMQISQALEEFVLVAPSDVVKSFFATVPVQRNETLGVLYLLQHPWLKPSISGECLCGAWQSEVHRTLLTTVGFLDEVSEGSEASEDCVLVLHETACRESVQLALARVLELLTASGDVSSSVASDASLVLDVSGSSAVQSASHSEGSRQQQDTASSVQMKSEVDCVNNFVESVVTALDENTVTGDADFCEVAITSILTPLHDVVSHSSELIANLPPSENSSLTGDLQPPTSSLADKGFADVEQLALAFTKVHGLLAGLGFIFNHNSELDNCSLHFPNSQHFAPAHAAVLQISQALEEFVQVAPSDVVKSFFATVPVQRNETLGVLLMLQRPWLKPSTTAECLRGAWQSEAHRTLLTTVGFLDEVSEGSEASEERVLVLQETACHESVQSALARVLELLTAGTAASSSLNSSSDGTPIRTRRSSQSQSKLSTEGSIAGSSGSSQQARCDLCQTKFGIIRWRHVCSFCFRELCRSCFETDPSSGEKVGGNSANSAAVRDGNMCAMCMLATSL